MRSAPRNLIVSGLFACILWSGTCASLSQAGFNTDEVLTAEQTEFFENRIRPVLVRHCYECHSGENTPKGGLRLDLRETMHTGGDSGPALVPGDPGNSLILKALRYEASEMPPDGRLPEAVIADFERWVQMGAPDPRTEAAAKSRSGIDYQQGLEFWAFRQPVEHPAPEVRESGWVKNDIDRFVLHGLEARGMRPAEAADRRTLIRRAYFDLTGLPPEPEAVESFVADESESAFEKVVDDLLASPHYGERWARHWLDLARYAEDQAHTFQARMYPQGFLYRDWVVNALNDDMPYKQFLRRQIVGEQDTTADSYRHRAALGLFALGPVYYQDNGEQEKAQADEWDDRIDTLMRGTQALTVSCARCHDHKYDPISMADYYGLAGIFASSEYRELPAVSEDVVAARQAADAAVQKQQLEIDTLLALNAPAARLKLTSAIPDYVSAAWKVAQSTEPNMKKRLDQVAKETRLNRTLLERWVAWLDEKPGSGMPGIERPYLSEWKAVRERAKAGTAASTDTEASGDGIPELQQLGMRLQARAESLISQRESLRQRFGDNYAFVAAEDRVVVEPGTIPLGNLFDDKKGALLTSALTSDPFRSTATKGSLGVDRVLQGWGGTAEIAPNVRFDFRSIGSDNRRHGDVTNDGWSGEGGIQTLGKRCSPSVGRIEQGIGMHANALITFDLDEIRRSGLIPASESMVFKVDRAGINDDALGSGASVHIAVIVSKPNSKPSEFDSIISAWLDGQPAEIEENDAVYSFAGTMPPPVEADGQFVSFDVPIPPDAKSLTLVTTGAQISDIENTISSDHAVFSHPRLIHAVQEQSIVDTDVLTPLEELPEDQQKQLKSDAVFLSELFDDRGVLGLAPDQIEPYLQPEPAAALTSLKKQLEDLKQAAAAISISMAHALVDGTGRDVQIYMAGDPKKKGETAPRSFPAILTSGHRQDFQPLGSGRAELAEAIASEQNPLTARVIVNRIWAGHFGTGLVKTLSNFGQLGDRPSHPELLDFLAVRFMKSGWSLKQLHRQILLSATYQQSSSGEGSHLEADPENRLLWKMNRRRLEVEPWRDAVLAVSGQLDRAVGGRSSELDGNHRRRTLYGYISRHRLNDLLRLFDFPDPNITAGERSVTTVPLQQLFVLNSDFMVTQAKALAARLHREAAADPDRIVRSYELLYGRRPTDEEQTAATHFLASASGDEGDKLSVLEQYCLAMLGTNEFVYID